MTSCKQSLVKFAGKRNYCYAIDNIINQPPFLQTSNSIKQSIKPIAKFLLSSCWQGGAYMCRWRRLQLVCLMWHNFIVRTKPLDQYGAARSQWVQYLHAASPTRDIPVISPKYPGVTSHGYTRNPFSGTLKISTSSHHFKVDFISMPWITIVFLLLQNRTENYVVPVSRLHPVQVVKGAPDWCFPLDLQVANNSKFFRCGYRMHHANTCFSCVL